MSTIESQTITRINPILKTFNNSVLGCTVDVRKETVTVLLRVPRTQQAQRLLKKWKMISRKKFQVGIQTIIFLHHIEKAINFGL